MPEICLQQQAHHVLLNTVTRSWLPDYIIPPNLLSRLRPMCYHYYYIHSTTVDYLNPLRRYVSCGHESAHNNEWMVAWPCLIMAVQGIPSCFHDSVRTGIAPFPTTRGIHDHYSIRGRGLECSMSCILLPGTSSISLQWSWREYCTSDFGVRTVVTLYGGMASHDSTNKQTNKHEGTDQLQTTNTKFRN